MDNLANTRIGDYRLYNEIGRGGMALVYRASHADFGTVAFKVLPAHLLHDRTIVTRFINEARAVGRLRHPHIVEFYAAGALDHPAKTGDSVYFIALEHIAGGSLGERLMRKRPLSLPVAISLGIEIGYALDYAHSKGFVHRDIKPSNLLFRDDGKAVLADFGIAKAADQARLTRTGSLAGTIAYIAPELIHGEPADARSDIYSLALVLYEAITGSRPFGDDEDSQPGKLMQRIIDMPIPPIRDVAPGVPEVVAQVIEQGCAKDPACRPESIGSFVAALQQARMGRPPSQPHVPLVMPRLPKLPGAAAPEPAPPAPRGAGDISDKTVLVPRTPVPPAADLPRRALPATPIALGAARAAPAVVPAPPRRPAPKYDLGQVASGVLIAVIVALVILGLFALVGGDSQPARSTSTPRQGRLPGAPINHLAGGKTYVTSGPGRY